MGGKCNTKRIKKKKANLGTEWKEMSVLNKINDITNGIGGAVGGIGGLIGGLTYNPKDYTLKHSDTIVAQQPKVINQNPILAQAKLGCKRIKKRNTNRFKQLNLAL